MRPLQSRLQAMAPEMGAVGSCPGKDSMPGVYATLRYASAKSERVGTVSATVGGAWAHNAIAGSRADQTNLNVHKNPS